ncbi:hypothetical protein BsWGS_13604 [Bradybaena similaris]
MDNSPLLYSNCTSLSGQFKTIPALWTHFCPIHNCIAALGTHFYPVHNCTSALRTHFCPVHYIPASGTHSSQDTALTPHVEGCFCTMLHVVWGIAITLSY